MRFRRYHKVHMIHEKGKLSAEGFKKKLLDIAVEDWYDFDGDVIFIRKGSKIAKYYVNVLLNTVVYCGIYHPKKVLKTRKGLIL